MPITLQQTGTSAPFSTGCSGHTNGVATAGREAIQGGSPGGSEVTLVAVASLGCDVLAFQSGQLDRSFWQAGDYTVNLNVTTANGNLNWIQTHVCEKTSTGSFVSLGSGGTTHNLSAVQVYSHVISLGSHTPNNPLSKLYFLIHILNEVDTSQSFGIIPNRTIQTPIAGSESLTPSSFRVNTLFRAPTIVVSSPGVTFTPAPKTVGTSFPVPAMVVPFRPASLSVGVNVGETLETVYSPQALSVRTTFPAPSLVSSGGTLNPAPLTVSVSVGEELETVFSPQVLEVGTTLKRPNLASGPQQNLFPDPLFVDVTVTRGVDAILGIDPLQVSTSFPTPAFTPTLNPAPLSVGITFTAMALGQDLTPAPLSVSATILSPSLAVPQTIVASPFSVSTTLNAGNFGSLFSPTPLSVEVTFPVHILGLGQSLTPSPLMVSLNLEGWIVQVDNRDEEWIVEGV